MNQLKDSSRRILSVIGKDDILFTVPSNSKKVGSQLRGWFFLLISCKSKASHFYVFEQPPVASRKLKLTLK